MKVFIEGFPMSEFPERRKVPGSLFTRLIGVDVSKNKYDLYNIRPMYASVVKFINISKSQKYFEFRLKKFWLTVHLMTHYPFIHFERIGFDQGEVEQLD